MTLKSFGIYCVGVGKSGASSLTAHFNFLQLSRNYLLGGQWDCWFCPRSRAFYTCLFRKYLAHFSGRQNVKEFVRAGNLCKATLFPANSDSRQAKPVNNGDCPRASLCLQWREYESAKEQAPTYAWDWFTQAHKSSKWGKLEVEVRNATCAVTHGALFKDRLTEWFQVSA